MNHPREPFERLLDVFDDAFRRVAGEDGFVFDPRIGHVGRAIRLKDDPLKRGVFLDFKNHWMQSDPVDPEVVLAYGAWFQPKPGGFPVYFLTRKFYEGKLSGLTACIDEKLELAAGQIQLVSENLIMREGKLFADWPKESQ